MRGVGGGGDLIPTASNWVQSQFSSTSCFSSYNSVDGLPGLILLCLASVGVCHLSLSLALELCVWFVVQMIGPCGSSLLISSFEFTPSVPSFFKWQVSRCLCTLGPFHFVRHHLQVVGIRGARRGVSNDAARHHDLSSSEWGWIAKYAFTFLYSVALLALVLGEPLPGTGPPLWAELWQPLIQQNSWLIELECW